jgi:hypothetical protein
MQDLVHENVGLKRAHEDQCGRPGVVQPHDAGRGGTAEVVLDDGQTASGRALAAAGIERHDERRGLRTAVHVDGDVLPDDALNEGDEALGDAAQDFARIGGSGIDGGELANEIRHVDGRSAAHGRREEGLLGVEMAQDSRGRDVELERDVSQSRGLEPFGGEDAPGRGQQLIAGDSRRPSHR